MSKILVDTIDTRSGTSTLTLGSSNLTTLNKASGVTANFGKIGQVIYAQTTTQSQSTSTSYATTGFSASITPTSTSSKILVDFNIHYQIFGNNADSNFGGNFKIVRTVSSTDTDVFSEANPTPRLANTHSGSAYLFSSYNLTELDEPSTTSACTYTIHSRVRDNGATTNNRISLSQDNAISSVTLMEVLA